MPSLHWAGKALPNPATTTLRLDSITTPGGAGYAQSEPQNHLFLGENLHIMAALLPQWRGKIQLIYADPPFYTNRNFRARIGRGEDSRKPQQWQTAQGYADSWQSLDEYLQFLYERLALMYELLAPGGSLYLHLDWHADAYARLLLDELFGAENLLNEIIWAYHGPSPIRSAFNRKHDTILLYTKGEPYTFNADAVRIPYDQATRKTFAASSKAGFGKIPDLERGKVPEDWWYFPVVARLHSERTGYPTQKPEALLERILLASSNPGDVVADFFCGSGTTPLTAARHGRRFLASDARPLALQTARARLVRAQASPFAIWQEASPALEAPIAIRGENLRVRLQDPAGIIYWEVDPDYDGVIFRSYAQAVLPLRYGEISPDLPLPQKQGRLCVRAVNAQNETLQQILD